jgi:hypothetical protein
LRSCSTGNFGCGRLAFFGAAIINGEKTFAKGGAFVGGEPSVGDAGAFGAEGFFDGHDDDRTGMLEELAEPWFEFARRGENELLDEGFDFGSAHKSFKMNNDATMQTTMQRSCIVDAVPDAKLSLNFVRNSRKNGSI